MFKKISIHLERPICSCTNDAKMSWWVTHANNRSGLALQCQKCKSIHYIEPDKFVATFEHEIPRPAPFEPYNLFHIEKRKSSGQAN